MSIEIGKHCNGCAYEYPMWICPYCKHQMNLDKDRCHYCGKKPDDILKYLKDEKKYDRLFKSILQSI